jgi:hypothetical protein
MHYKLNTIVLAAICGLSTLTESIHAQGTAFTYQGRLNAAGAPADGVYDIAFSLFGTNTGGVAMAGPVTNTAVGVTNGLFTTTVDFGAAFTGSSNWLQIAVSSNSANAFSPLSPRQQVTPTPYAIYAESANGGGLFGTIAGDGGGLTNLNAVNLTGIVAPSNLSADVALLDADQTFSGINNFSQNVGIGTSSPQVRLQIVGTGTSDDARLMVQSAASGTLGPQLRLNRAGTGGDEWVFVNSAQANGPINSLQVVQSSAGTRLMIATNGNVGIGTTSPNSTLAVFGNIFMGTQRNNTTFNQIGDTIYLGAEQKYLGNTLQTPVDGTTDWINLMANPLSAGIMFGLSGPTTTNPHTNFTPLMVIRSNGNVGIGGGVATNPATALQVNGTVTATGFAGNGSGLTNVSGFNLNGPITFQQNAVSPDLIMGYSGNYIAPGVSAATIGGGGQSGLTNSVTASNGTVSGGVGNTAGLTGTVGGGYGNKASGTESTVGGGQNNTASAQYATVTGGNGNTASANATTVSGEGNSATNLWATVVGGSVNIAGGVAAAIGGGYGNTATGGDATVPGGQFNVAAGSLSFAAGQKAQALHQGAFVWADSQNAVFASTANNQFLIRAQGGVGIDTTTPAGELSVATAQGTVNIMDGPFTPELVMTGGSVPGDLRLRNMLEVWPNTNATAAGKVDVRGTNGLADIILDGSNGNVTCVALNITSDRNAKTDFTAINPRDVLARVAAMPITEWQYKKEADTRHIGPMAQDFSTAFGLNGGDDKHISVVDEGGVALAAIQGLNQKLDEKDSRIQAQAAEIQTLNQTVSQLKQMVEELGRKVSQAGAK